MPRASRSESVTSPAFEAARSLSTSPTRRSVVVREGHVLTQDIATSLREFLPPMAKEATEWKVVYSLDSHGISINTLFKNTSALSPHEPLLMAIKSSSGHVFGAFLNQPLIPTKGFYGNGACFLWKWSNGILSAYLSSGANNYHILSEPNQGIAFGSGSFRIRLAKASLGSGSTLNSFKAIQAIVQPLTTRPWLAKKTLRLKPLNCGCSRYSLLSFQGDHDIVSFHFNPRFKI